MVKRGKVPRRWTCWKRTNTGTCIKLDKGFDCFLDFEKESGMQEKLVSPKQKKPHCESMKDQQSISN